MLLVLLMKIDVTGFLTIGNFSCRRFAVTDSVDNGLTWPRPVFDVTVESLQNIQSNGLRNGANLCRDAGQDANFFALA
jgi:hypothetical protein